MCLEVKGQSRADGVEIQENVCTGASNQLWLSEVLRRNEYETLYQADKNRCAWLTTPDDSLPYGVEVTPQERICRAADAHWLGVIRVDQCVGKTYEGRPAATSRYETLYQAP
jgi:hypothetical protein